MRWFFASSMVAVLFTVAVPANGASASWWWSRDWAAERAAFAFAFGGAYWNVGCAGVGARRFYDVRALAVSTKGEELGQRRLPYPSWKFRRFRCVRIRPGGWTVFDVRVVNGLDFWLEPSEGTPYEITTPRRVP